MPTATPLFTKRDPVTGAVLFDFDGHIHAEGLDFDAGPIAAAGTLQEITWRRHTDNERVAFVQAWQDNFNARQMNAGVKSDGAGGNFTGLVSIHNPTAAAGSISRLQAWANSNAKTLLRDDFVSDWLFNAHGGGVKLDMGVGTCTWAGGSTVTPNVNIPHALNRVPIAIIVGQRGGSHYAHITANGTWAAGTFGCSAITVDGSVPGAGETATFGWIAAALMP